MTDENHAKPATPRPRRGRPPLLGEDKQAELCKLLAEGVSMERAAQFIGCSTRTIERRARRDRAFRQRVQRARTEAAMYPLMMLRQAAAHNWRAAKWFLERRPMERFGFGNSPAKKRAVAIPFPTDLYLSNEREPMDQISAQTEATWTDAQCDAQCDAQFDARIDAEFDRRLDSQFDAASLPSEYFAALRRDKPRRG